MSYVIEIFFIVQKFSSRPCTIFMIYVRTLIIRTFEKVKKFNRLRTKVIILNNTSDKITRKYILEMLTIIQFNHRYNPLSLVPNTMSKILIYKTNVCRLFYIIVKRAIIWGKT